MSQVKRKVLACAMSVVMAFSMMSATAMSAFADDLAAGIGNLSAQSSNGAIVYDTAYGVLGGKYALMMKTVTYEAEYKGGTQTYTATVTDLARADGKITVHTSNATQDNDAIPGEWTDLRQDSNSNEGLDVMAGYMKVSDKNTGKSGVLSVDGDEILPCSYDSISAIEDGFVAVKFEDGSVKYDFVAKDGTPAGSFSTATEQAARWSYVTYYADGYVKVEASWTGGRATAFAHKEGGKYVQVADIEKVYTYTSDRSFLCAKSDGNVHYIAADGTDKVIAPSEGVSSALLNYKLVSLTVSNAGTTFYSTDGTKLKDAGSGSSAAALEDVFVFKPTGQSGDVATYEIYDYSGTLKSSFEAAGVQALDATRFSATQATATEGEYELGVYGADGKLVKNLGAFGSSYQRVWVCTENVGSEAEAAVKTVIGYRVVDEEAYYDENFDRLDYSLADAKVYALSDGKKVFVTESSTWNSETKSYDRKATVVDESGNPVKLGGYTLGVPTDERTYFPWNSPKHGNADLWWASDGAGKWGAVDSTGAVVVPFEYESYFDSGVGATDYAMVREDGVWKFLQVANVAAEPDPVAPGGNGASGQDQGSAGDGSKSDQPASVAPKVMHRLYNQWSGEHFYTSDEEEYAGLVALGWTDEGEGWKAPELSDTPVYRMYNPYAGEHHYCMKAEERDALVDAGWTDEGIGWYSDDEKTTPLYREYNPYEFANNHNYTTDEAEHDNLVSLGWIDEGYAWYGL